jgi:hypothetical protein
LGINPGGLAFESVSRIFRYAGILFRPYRYSGTSTEALKRRVGYGLRQSVFQQEEDKAAVMCL